MDKIQAILFDLDGTLWNSSKEVLTAWNQVLAKHPECNRELITQEELNGCFGLPMTDIAARLFTKLDEKGQQALMDECCEVENDYLRKHGAVLFPKLEETLAKLHENYQLYVVSNCQQGYIESFITAHKLEKYFDDIECWGNNLLPKGENNKLIMKRNGITRAVYVGDTAGDEQSARVAEIPFVYAAYGFGKAVAPDYTLMSFAELPDLMKKMEIPQGLEIEECLALMLDRADTDRKTCEVPLMRACGMVTAQDVVSGVMVPPFAKAAMDGYAVRASDIEGATAENPVSLQVAGELFAGDTQDITYQSGTAVRVMTGAPITDGYDAVVRQEDTDYGETEVKIYTQIPQYRNYCKKGEDIFKGQTVIPQNTRLEPVHIGLLAEIGMNQVIVYEPVKAAIISTGTELVLPGQALTEGKIYNNISYILASSMQREGVQVNFVRTCADEEELVSSTMKEALAISDVVITTGAISVGKRDIVPKVLLNMGADILFNRAKIQPGTPTMASIMDGKVILSLSGNPYAALANFNIYFWPLLAKMLHHESFDVKKETAILQSEYNKVNKMRRFLRARVENGNVYLPTENHASSVIQNLTQCNCMIDLEAGRKADPGDEVTIQYIK